MVPCGQVARLLPARPLNQRHSGFKCRICIEFGGVEHVRVIGRLERRNGAIGVTLVPSLDVGQGGIEIGGFTAAFELTAAAARPLLRRCGQKDLHLRIRRNHGSNIAAIQHRSGWRGRKLALEVDQGGPDIGNSGDDRGGAAEPVALERASSIHAALKSRAAAIAAALSSGLPPASSTALATAR